MSVARNTVNTEQTDQPLLNSQGGASEVSPTTFNEVLPELKHITMTYLLDTDEHTPTLPSNLLTKTSVDPDLLDISFSSRHARYQDPYKYTKTAFKLYVSCAETVMTRADDVNAPPQTACEAVTCKIITYSLGGIMCSPLMCCGVFADGAQALKRQHQLSKDNKVLQDVIGPTIQRMV